MTDKKFISLLASADAATKAIMQRMVRDLAKINISYEDLPDDEFFSFDKYPEAKKAAARIVERYAAQLEGVMAAATEKAMRLAYQRATKAVSALNLPTDIFAVSFSKGIVSDFEQYRDAHRKGLNLSQRVWNYTSQAKAEFEMAMSACLEDGIEKGTSAEELGRRVRKMLNRPNEVYRRYHMKKMQSDGTKKDVIEWRRRTIDADGNVHFTSTDIEKVGRGVYRSSRQNALRLTSNEINMAYKYADNVRMNDDKFCRGYEIRLSNSHPEYDICDELQGAYPKQFLFTGFHARCRCTVIPIVCSLQERLDYLDLTPQQQAQWQPKEGYITDVPNAFKKYVGGHVEQFTNSIKSNTGAYFIRDNKALIQDIIKAQK